MVSDAGIAKQAAWLHYIDGLSWPDVAKHFPGCSKSKVKTAGWRWWREHNAEASAETDGSDKAEWQEDGNYATATSLSRRIRSLDDLLDECKADLSVWEVRQHDIKTWEGYAANVNKDLIFDEGKITGSASRHGIITETLWSVRANFARINPTPLRPVVRPVECAANYRKPPEPDGEGIRRSLIFTDPHIGYERNIRTGRLIPFHDRLALDVVLQLVVAIQPDRIDILGDFLDLAEWSDRFVQELGFEQCTQPAVCEGHWWLRQFREACPDSYIGLHQGNHDARMRRALLKHMRAACELRPADEMDLPPSMSPERLLALHKLGIEWRGDYPDDEAWLGEGLRLSHGDVARQSFATVKKIADRSAVDEIVGHIHRKEMASKTYHNKGGSFSTKAYCPGCVCRVDGIVPAQKANQQWQQGCAVVDYEQNGTMFAICDIGIDHGAAVWDGKRFEGRDRVADLGVDLPDWAW